MNNLFKWFLIGYGSFLSVFLGYANFTGKRLFEFPKPISGQAYNGHSRGLGYVPHYYHK